MMTGSTEHHENREGGGTTDEVVRTIAMNSHGVVDGMKAEVVDEKTRMIEVDRVVEAGGRIRGEPKGQKQPVTSGASQVPGIREVGAGAKVLSVEIVAIT